MLGSPRKSPEFLQSMERVKDSTRQRFGLAEDAVVLVTEVACVVPGCPPLETVVAFWTADEKAHHEKLHTFKVFKPLQEVVEDDIPPAWMLEALAEEDSYECC
jgi:hypothetical protein